MLDQVRHPLRSAAARRVLGSRYHRLFPDWHRHEVGGLWETVGPLQAEFLVAQGLRPEHRLLDVGCGALRAGVHLIRHLDAGRYHGIDASAELLAAARVEIDRHGLAGKAPRLHRDEHFDVGAFGAQFDFAIAHSLFTHLPVNSILVCLRRVEEVLRPGGRLYATFFENPKGTRQIEVLSHEGTDPLPLQTYPDADPYHYGVDLFEWLCDGTGLRVEYIGDWGHPRSQRMLRFTA